MRVLSLRTRLLVLLLGAVLLTWSAASYTMVRDARRETDALLDAQLAQSARLLLAEAPHRLRESAEEDEEEHHGDDSERSHDGEGGDSPEVKYEHKLFYQFWDSRGRLLFRSSGDVPQTALTGVDDGFLEHAVGGQTWRTYALWNSARTLQIQIGLPVGTLEKLAETYLRHVLLPALALLPLLALLIWWAVGTGWLPCGRLPWRWQGVRPKT